MASLAALTLSALLSVCRPPACVPEADGPRLEALAADIAAVVDERDALAAWLPGAVDPLPWGGSVARERAALALVAIVFNESALRADVADCRRVGTDFDSITSYQLLGRFAFGPYTRAELCASPRRAAERALAVLAHHARCCGPAPIAAFRGYSSGDCRVRSAAAARQHALWERLVARYAPTQPASPPPRKT